MAVNAVFIGLEKAKGNTLLILILNIIAMTIKLILSATFVYGLGKGTDYVALATVIAQGLLMVAALAVMFDKKNSLHLNLKELTLKNEFILPILMLALPVFSGKFLFSLGKVLVNSMAAFYGPLAIAAFGIALKLDGGAGAFSNVFEESETSIISLNLGGRNLKRAVETGKMAQWFALVVSIIGTAITVLCLGWMVPLFMKDANPALENMVLSLWEWERYSIITSAVIAVISGFFIGFKMSKVSFFLNIIRLFVFRLPVVWLLQQLGVGYESLGYAMFLSNTMTMIIGEIIFIIFVHKVKNFGFMDMQYRDNFLEIKE
jgi:Na+-driven multidrug efflux pump